MKIELPVAPDMALSANQTHGRHYGSLSKMRKSAKEDMRRVAHCRAAEENWVCPEVAILHLSFQFADHHRRDLDNVISACKPWIDGLVDAGVIKDDDMAHLLLGKVEARVGAKAKTVIEVEAIWTAPTTG